MAAPPLHDAMALVSHYRETRARMESLAARLSPEDQQVQSMPDASPTKWHRAHTTWFFESFVLAPENVATVNDEYAFLFNSYYDARGPRHPRSARGMLSRPSAAEITEYRRVVDRRVEQLLKEVDSSTLRRIAPVVELGVAHEEQHQELLLTDILHAFSESPLRPAYGAAAPPAAHGEDAELAFVGFDGGLVAIGAPGATFAFDNERPEVAQLFGDAWEWTLSSYSPYPGYRAPRGALGEYNAKFMVGQQVLRGGSALTPARHVRSTYRNFWHPATRFQMSGVRLARGIR